MKRCIYRCEDSMEGLFTALYEAWKCGWSEEEIGIEICSGTWNELCLFAEYTDVVSDIQKSLKVQRIVQERISEETLELVKKAALSRNSEKGQIIFHFLNYAFRMGPHACRSYGNPWAMKLFEIVRNYGNEVHRWMGFLRFEQREGILFARYASHNNVLGDLMQHFSDRMNAEFFMILDETYRVLGVHPVGGEWLLYRLSEEEYQRFEGLEKSEDSYGECWRAFYSSIMIKERENRALQRNNLPLWYRTYMTEFVE